MTINSMTGFARSEGFHDGITWSWEVRSVNARNLDVRFRLPPGHDRLEANGRGAVSRKFKRGTISLSLVLARAARSEQVRLNREMLDQVLTLAKELKEQTGLAPRPDGLLGLRGVLESVEEEETEEQRDARFARMAETLEEALDRLAETRNEEGARILTAVNEHLKEIERLCTAAEETAAAQPEAIKGRLEQRLNELLGPDATVSEERLEQEIALLATRADVREELDRLKSHVEAARELLAADDAVGRRLDFLCQEFNREANTLCSKSSDLELTRIGLDLKTAVDRLREQIQNLE